MYLFLLFGDLNKLLLKKYSTNEIVRKLRLLGRLLLMGTSWELKLSIFTLFPPSTPYLLNGASN